jgi:hypothetical protein
MEAIRSRLAMRVDTNNGVVFFGEEKWNLLGKRIRYFLDKEKDLIGLKFTDEKGYTVRKDGACIRSSCPEELASLIRKKTIRLTEENEMWVGEMNEDKPGS